MNSVQEFTKKLEQLENNRISQKPHSIIGKFHGSDGQLTKTDEEKINLIRNYAIPNTKEDILEFMILASSNIDLKLYGLGNQGILTASQRAVSDAWLAKFDQAYEKAIFSFENPLDLSYIQNLYNKKKKQLRSKKIEIILLIISIVASPCIIFALLYLLCSSLL